MKTTNFFVLSAGLAVLCLAIGGTAIAGTAPGSVARQTGAHREITPQAAPVHLAGAGGVTHVRGKVDAGGQIAPQRGAPPTMGHVKKVFPDRTGPHTNAGGQLEPRRTPPAQPPFHVTPIRPKTDVGGQLEPKRTGRATAGCVKVRYENRMPGQHLPKVGIEPQRGPGTIPAATEARGLDVQRLRPRDDAGGHLAPHRVRGR